VAAGAPSDAEVKAQLQQLQAVERSAKKTRHARLAPVPGGRSIGGDGTIPIPTNVPEAVQKVVAGANEIADFPYVFGGGHASFVDNAYDCSGSVSYALAAGGLLDRPMTSGDLENWGAPGPGRYITVMANAGHTYMYVDGIMYNTAGRSGVYASRWQVSGVDNTGFVVRHFPGL
jgi:cell wall-associated NlpC family hydrolase